MRGALSRTLLVAALLSAGWSGAAIPDHVGPAVEDALLLDDRRVEAARASAAIQDITAYEIDVCVDPGSRRLAAAATIRVSILGDRVDLLLDEHLRVLSVDRAGGQRLLFERSGRRLRIPLAAADGRRELEIVIRYEGRLEPGDGVALLEDLVLLSGPSSWYPASGHSDPAAFRIVARHPESFSSVCTGSLMGMAPLRTSAEPACAAGDVWVSRAPLPRADLVVGRLESRRSLWGDRILDFSWVTSDSLRPSSRRGGSLTAEIKEPVRYLESCFGDYPFEWLHIVAVPWKTEGRYSSGPGLVLVRSAHELGPASMVPSPERWIGALSRSWWPFTVDVGPFVSAALAGSAETGWFEIIGEEELAEARRERLHGQYLSALADSGGRAPLTACLGTDPSVDPRVCRGKGSVVFSLLADVLGRDAFCSALARLRGEHSGGVAALRDLLDALETASGRDLDWFFYEWIARGDLPTYLLEYDVAPRPGGRFAVRGVVRQEGEIFRTPIPLTVDLGGWAYEEWIPIESSEQPFEIVTDAEPYGVAVDTGRRVPRIDLDERALLHYERGRAAVAANEWGVAIDEFGAAASLRPGIPEYLFSYGEALVRSGRVSDGLPVLERAIALRPGDPAWRLWVAAVEAAAGQLASALGHLDAYVGLRPDDPIGAAERAIVLVDSGDLDGASAALARARSVVDTSAAGIPDRVWVAEGMLREARGDTAAAMAAYENALRANPVSDEARGRLLRLRGADAGRPGSTPPSGGDPEAP